MEKNSLAQKMSRSMQKRVNIFKNGCRIGGKVISLSGSLDDLLRKAEEKLNLPEATAVYTAKGGLVDDVDLIRDDEVLYISNGEPFIDPDLICHCQRFQLGSSFVDCDLTYKASKEWVALNVGGKRFMTSRSTLTKEPDTMLARMFSPEDSWSSVTDNSGAYLIDRSPVYFEPLLNYLRHGVLVIDEGVNPRGVLEEAMFFGIAGVIDQLEEMVKSMEKTDDTPLTRNEFVRILMATPSDCELRGQGMNLEGADLSKLDLRNINFKLANLRNTNLAGANLSNSCLEMADLTGSHMDGAILSSSRLQRASLERASLKGCNFEEIDGTGALLEGANLKASDLEGSQMTNVNLRVATLKGANLKNCNLRGAILAGADLENCNLGGCDLQNANLRGANVVEATFKDIVTPLHMSQSAGAIIARHPPST